MIRRIASVLALAVFALPSFGETATEKSCEAKACTAKECASGICASGACPIEAAMAKLPKMTYLVGKEETCCAQSAAKLASEHKDAIKYVVAKKTFAEEGQATVALAEATEKFVSSFTTPSQCEVSGKFTVAGKALCCEVMAGERAKLAKAAMKDVALTYLVGDQKCSCPVEATKIAKETGKDKVFLVGTEKTCCSVDARVKLARAKYLAAVEALAKSDAPTSDES